MSKKYSVAGGLALLVLVSWLAFGSESEENPFILVTPQKGLFEVNVITTGELQAKNSTSILGPERMREFRLFNVAIQKLIPEGTVVEEGDFVAELDRSGALSALQDAQLSLEEELLELQQAVLDCTLTLSEARDELINLEYAVEESKIVVKQSIYESPAVQRQVQIDYEQARRQFEQAKKNYEIRVQQAETTLKSQRAEIQEERNDIAKIKKIMAEFTIYAPQNGMVIYKRNRDGSKVTVGSTISPWDPVVAELPDFSVMESITYINEVDIQSIKEGQLVDIGLDAMPEKELTGVITDVANIGEQSPNTTSKVFRVTIRINESDRTLRPAMTTSNIIHVNSVDSALYLPLETVHAQDSMSIVYKRENLQPVIQQVILGMMNKNSVVIKEGITMDDQLYLSMPQDTSGIRREYLAEDILQKYREENQKKEEPIEQRRQDENIQEEISERIQMIENNEQQK